jgi:outer membrane lipopolysaccharide assembly protein LptE/RlpB
MSMIRSAMSYYLLVLLALLLTSCGLKFSQKDEAELINRSALYDPPVVTLSKGEAYQFAEGVYTPTEDAKFYSKYQYLRALTIGK